MAKLPLSNKHVQISKDSTTITITLAIASFVAIACLVGSRAMLQQRSYQAKVIAEKEVALQTLKTNVDAANSLVTSYTEFTQRPENIIGGSTNGTGERDGDNAKIILDALPSTYDFPALVSSVDKLIAMNGLTTKSITGTDDEVAQAAKNSTQPEVVEIPFTFVVDGGYDGLYGLVDSLERSIRPIQVTSMKLSTSTSGDSVSITAKTFYQSGKELNITTKVVQ